MVTRPRLLQAARELFLAQGLDVSLEQIARHAGTTRQSLYNHFAGKPELLMQVFEQLTDEMQLPLEGIVRHDAQELPQVLQHIAATVQSHLFAATTLSIHRLLVQATAQMPALLRSMHERRAGRLRQRLADLLQHLHRQGRVQVDAPALAATAFLGAVMGYAYPMAILNERAPDPAAQRALAEEAIASFLLAWRYRADPVD